MEVIQNHLTPVTAALDLLLETIEMAIDSSNQGAVCALKAHDHNGAKKALKQAEKLTASREKVVALQREWDHLALLEDKETEVAKTAAIKVSRRNRGRLPRGRRPPEDASYLPILPVLARRGGSGKVAEVLKEVYKEMNGILREVDLSPYFPTSSRVGKISLNGQGTPWPKRVFSRATAPMAPGRSRKRDLKPASP
ncbi:hypothetical protein NIES2134_110040 [Thermostichus vulcanus NIES-2134]|nr:hypothetical protein NIES2134_110040 [Thermostichus vulcanus NIES-2134]